MQSNTGKSILDLLKELQSPTNDLRNAAENQIKTMRQSHAMPLLQQLSQTIVAPNAASDNLSETVLACILLKKYYLDKRREEQECEQIGAKEIKELKAGLTQSLDFGAQPMNLLRKKAELITKLHKLDESFGELVGQV